MRVLGLAFSIWVGLQNVGFGKDIVIVEKLKPQIHLPKNNELNEVTIINILQSMHENKALIVPTKSFNAECFSIKALKESAKGRHSGQLFSVSLAVSCFADDNFISDNEYVSIYIIKEMMKGKREIKNLNKIANSIIDNERIPMDEFISRTEKDPIEKALIAFEEAYFSVGSGINTRYFSILQKARGNSLISYLKKFGHILNNYNTEDQEIAKSEMKNIFYRVGFAVSKLHQDFSDTPTDALRKTFIHGDFHGQNIFYDSITGNVSLIDNETFSMSLLHKKSGLHDIADLYLLHTTRTLAHKFAKQLIVNTDMGIEDALWHELWRELFLGYIMAFDKLNSQERLLLLDEFKIVFYRCLSKKRILSNINNFTDQRKLKLLGSSKRRKTLQQTYLNDIFVSLRKEFMRI